MARNFQLLVQSGPSGIGNREYAWRRDRHCHYRLGRHSWLTVPSVRSNAPK
jgi:hypothetical protein